MTAQAPLDWRAPIVNSDGTPTNAFMRLWNNQRALNSGIHTITVGGGAPPDDLIGTAGDLYVDDSSTPDVLYVWDDTLATPGWSKVGVSEFTDLGDVPHAYTGAAGLFVRVNGAHDGLAFLAVNDSDVQFTDITTGNVSIAEHGFVPKAPNDATKYLDGTGAFSVPSGSGGGGSWLPLVTGGYTPVIQAVFPTSLQGLTLSTAGASSSFGVAEGAACDSTGAKWYGLPAAFTKTTGAWAVGSGFGALDTGSIANSTWYHVYLITKADLSVTDVLISTSATSPTMPSGYTLKRRIGSLLTDGSAHWTAFTQLENVFVWAQPTIDANNVATSTAPSNVPISTPLGVSVDATLIAVLSNPAGTATYKISVYPVGGTVGGLGNIYNSVTSGFAAAQVEVTTNTSSQVTVVANAAGATYYVGVVSWRDSFTAGVVSSVQSTDAQPEFVTDGAGRLIAVGYTP